MKFAQRLPCPARHSGSDRLYHRCQVFLPARHLPACLDADRRVRSSNSSCAAAISACSL